MRMEELSNSQYIKSTDTVERYLLGLVEQYFKHSNAASTTSREYIIKKAVERMREELSFESIGVLSITLPSGEVRTGAISISLEDLGGEPAISPKLSAFNVPFGTEQNTACEGNDPRLSDKRYPLAHKHEITEIVGLEGILSSLTGKLERLTGFMHEHVNKSVLDMLIYNGTQSTLDLSILETFDVSLNKIADDIRVEIIGYKNDTATKISNIETGIVDIKNSVNQLYQDMLQTNNATLALAKEYTDDAITQAIADIDNEVNGLATKESFTPLLATVNQAYSLAGSMEFNVNDYLTPGAQAFKQAVEINISADILTELVARVQDLTSCQIEAYIEYIEPTAGIMVRSLLPYVSFEDSTIRGSLQLSTNTTENKIVLSFTSSTGNMPVEIAEAKIIYNVYSMKTVSL